MKYKKIIVVFLLLFQLVVPGQIVTDCPWPMCISSNYSLPDQCEELRLYVQAKNPYSSPYSITVTWNFGDGSPTVSDVYPSVDPNVGDGSVFPYQAHNYAPGTYTAFVTVTGGIPLTGCSFATSIVCASSTVCEGCLTYTVLNTGYDKTSNLPMNPTPTLNAGSDPTWLAYKTTPLIPPNYGENVSGVTILNTAATVIFPNKGYCNGIYPPMGKSRYISYNSSHQSTGSPNTCTYRAYFVLPTPLPGPVYTMQMRLRADDGIYEVKVNNTTVKSPSLTTSEGVSYSGPPMLRTVTSCDGIFVAGTNTLDVTVFDLGGSTQLDAEVIIYQCGPILCAGNGTSPFCNTCASSFAPVPGKKYLLSAWAKEKNAAQAKTSYTIPGIKVLFPSLNDSIGPFVPEGKIIDGWQRIEGEFVIPSMATDMNIRLDCDAGDDCYFDDIRVLPFDGSLKSYVYDPVTLRLVAELDERNYATLYEYDEEGKLIRVKKETERGKMTIKENRDNLKK